MSPAARKPDVLDDDSAERIAEGVARRVGTSKGGEPWYVKIPLAILEKQGLPTLLVLLGLWIGYQLGGDLVAAHKRYLEETTQAVKDIRTSMQSMERFAAKVEFEHGKMFEQLTKITGERGGK